MFCSKVDTTPMGECEDVALVTGPDGELSDRTCAQSVGGRGRNQCAGRLGEQCPVTCGLCGDMTTMEPSEPDEEDTTTDAPTECAEVALVPSDDCPWLWQDLESNCDAIDIGDRCQPEQSYPELGMDDWDINNCGICSNFDFRLYFLTDVCFIA